MMMPRLCYLASKKQDSQSNNNPSCHALIITADRSRIGFSSARASMITARMYDDAATPW
jgi:hypothetical protein